MRTKHKTLRRRRFLELSITATAAGTLAGCSRPGGGPYWRFFNAAEAKLVDAVCEQIIPADKDPGASEAGVVNFIDLQLVKRHKKHQAAYRKGIAGVDAASRSKFNKSFVELPSEQQAEVLMDVETSDGEFFNLIRAHTMQGFYGDPRHGGNRGEVSWKMVGLPSPPVRGRLPYERKAG
jgi:gluconate 2-dehydrogenase gamma chain